MSARVPGRGGGGGRPRRRRHPRRSRGEGTGPRARRRRDGGTRTPRPEATRSPGRVSPRAGGTGGSRGRGGGKGGAGRGSGLRGQGSGREGTGGEDRNGGWGMHVVRRREGAARALRRRFSGERRAFDAQRAESRARSCCDARYRRAANTRESRDAGTEARGVGRTCSSWVSWARARVTRARVRARRAGTRARTLAGATAAPNPSARVVIAAECREFGAVQCRARRRKVSKRRARTIGRVPGAARRRARRTRARSTRDARGRAKAGFRTRASDDARAGMAPQRGGKSRNFPSIRRTVGRRCARSRSARESSRQPSLVFGSPRHASRPIFVSSDRAQRGARPRPSPPAPPPRCSPSPPRLIPARSRASARASALRVRLAPRDPLRFARL